MFWDLQIPSTNPKFGISSLGFARLGICSAYPKPKAPPWDMRGLGFELASISQTQIPSLGFDGLGLEKRIWDLSNPKVEKKAWDIVVGIWEAWDMLSISQAQRVALGYARFGICVGEQIPNADPKLGFVHFGICAAWDLTRKSQAFFPTLGFVKSQLLGSWDLLET